MNSKKGDTKVAGWSTGKLILIVYGLFTLCFLALILPISFVPEPLGLYVTYALSVCIGLALVIFGTSIGCALYEVNRRLGSSFGYNFTVWIMRIIGLLLILTPLLFTFVY